MYVCEKRSSEREFRQLERVGKAARASSESRRIVARTSAPSAFRVHLEAHVNEASLCLFLYLSLYLSVKLPRASLHLI